MTKPLVQHTYCIREINHLILLERTTPTDVDDDEDIADLPNSSLSAVNAFSKTPWSSIYLFLRSSELLSFPKEAMSVRSSSMILLRTSEQRGKKRFPSSTVKSHFRLSVS